MSILLKHTFKNVFKKPLRTILLTICIMFCAFSALLCLDMQGSIRAVIQNMFSQTTGNSDIIMQDTIGVPTNLLQNVDGLQYVQVATYTGSMAKPVDGQYTYFHREGYIVSALNLTEGYHMQLIPSSKQLSDSEIIINPKMAALFSCSEGDNIVLQDTVGKNVTFTVAEICENRGLLFAKAAGYISTEGAKRLQKNGEIRFTTAYVDVENDAEVAALAKRLQNEDLRADVEDLQNSEDLQEMMSVISKICLLIFSVCFLLVVFVTISVSTRIVSERMAVVGTFRSIGISAAMSMRILILENALYGLFGSILGCLLYSLARMGILSSFMMVESTEAVRVDYGSISVFTYLAVILASILVECLCPLKQMLNASRMSIRDIIFDNKDTKYKMSKASWISGLISLLGAIVCGCLPGSFISLMSCFVLWVFALALLFPILLTVVGKGLSQLFGKLKMPIAALAANESYARKSTVSGAGLCVTATLLSLMLFSLVVSAKDVYAPSGYDCDLILQTESQVKTAELAFIPNLEQVTAAEYVYSAESEVLLNGQKKTINVFAYQEGGYDGLPGLAGLPEKPEPDSFVIDEKFAEGLGLQIGDEVEVTFQANSYLPIVKTLRLSGFCDSFHYDMVGKSIAIDRNLYKSIYHDCPSRVLVRSTNPEEVRKQLNAYAGGLGCTVETFEEYKQSCADKSVGMKAMLMAVIALGVGLTVIGVSSNQMIGFEGRKRECAVLASCVMTRAKIAKMLLLESVIAIGTALAAAFGMLFVVNVPLEKLMILLAGTSPKASVLPEVLFIEVLWIIFVCTSGLPIRNLYKMKLANSLKYE